LNWPGRLPIWPRVVDLAGLALDDVDARIVLVHHEHEGLGGITGESQRDRSASV